MELRSLPGVRVLVGLGPLLVLRYVAVLGLVTYALIVTIDGRANPLAGNADPITYLAAGERLNAGHPLYALGPDDRPLVLRPPYWSVPLLSPPPIAALWRPLALFGEPAAVVWWLGGVASMTALAGWLVARANVVGLAILIGLIPAFALTGLSGNANAYLIPLLAAAWRWRSVPWLVGLVIVFATAVKLTPVLLVLWLIAHRRLRALIATLLTGLSVLLLSLAGAGWDAWTQWWSTVPISAPSPLSLSSLTGMPASQVFLVCVCVAAILVFWTVGRRRENLAFAVAVVAVVAASPAFYFGPVAMLSSALATTAGRTPARKLEATTRSSA